MPSAAFSPSQSQSTRTRTSTSIGVPHNRFFRCSVSDTGIALSASKRSGAMSRKNKSSASSGFDKGPTEPESTKDDTLPDDSSSSSGGGGVNMNMNSGSIYSRPALYDLAFGYRNYEEEVKFLLDVYNKYSITSASPTTDTDTDTGSNAKKSGINILELAAGPARHTITALRNHGAQISSCTAVDMSEDMVQYSNEIADEELGDGGFGGMRDKFQYILEDMRTVGNKETSSALKQQSGTFDSAWILLGSMQHLTRNDDVISCLSSTSNLLREGGILTIELPHPRETFTMVECTRNGWEVPLEDEDGEEYGELKIIWGDENDKFDPITQVRDFTVALDLVMNEDSKGDNPDLENVREIVPMRLFTFQEIEVMGRIAGFEIADMYGALSDEVDVNGDEAFRLVCILRKVRSPLDL